MVRRFFRRGLIRVRSALMSPADLLAEEGFSSCNLQEAGPAVGRPPGSVNSSHALAPGLPASASAALDPAHARQLFMFLASCGRCLPLLGACGFNCPTRQRLGGIGISGKFLGGVGGGLGCWIMLGSIICGA